MAPKASQSCPPQLWNSHPGHRFKPNKVKGRQHKTLMAVSNAHEVTCSLWGLLLKGRLPLSFQWQVFYIQVWGVI